MTLSQQQLNIIDLLGYLKLPCVFKDEIAGLTDAFDQCFEEYSNDVVPWDHVVHGNKPRQIMPQIADKSSAIRAFLKSPKLVELISSVLGEGYQFIGSDANIYDCGTRWHTDLIGLPYNCKNIKIIFYLDEAKINEDCFRVIPGSHYHKDQFSKRLKKNIREPQATLAMDMEDIPCQQISVQPGDAVLFDARIWHAVGYAGNTRRAFSFLFGDKNYQPPEEGNTHPVQDYD